MSLRPIVVGGSVDGQMDKGEEVLNCTTQKKSISSLLTEKPMKFSGCDVHTGNLGAGIILTKITSIYVVAP